jgi:hypothetical protein
LPECFSTGSITFDGGYFGDELSDISVSIYAATDSVVERLLVEDTEKLPVFGDGQVVDSLFSHCLYRQQKTRPHF